MTTEPSALSGPSGRSSECSISVIGLACRYPDADDPAALLDLVVTGRRAFRRIPAGLADVVEGQGASPDGVGSIGKMRAALIEDWQFDRVAFGLTSRAYASAEPARWLALETAARAVAAAGFPSASTLPSGRVGTFMATPGASPQDGAAPRTGGGKETAEGSAEAVSAAISRQLGLGSEGAVQADSQSSLAAVATACASLANGEIDVAIAGGADTVLDPDRLARLTQSGSLATGDLRIYDEHPTGFLPGEGSGVVVLMRTADALAAGLPVYAEILGWGTSSGESPLLDRSSRLLAAMWRAYDMAQVDPLDVQLIEGCGTGVPSADEAELAALTTLRAGASHVASAGRVAALGSVSANIGDAGAAAGVASLMKAVLAASSAVLPPSTGTRAPHPILRDGNAGLRSPDRAESWQGIVRHAAVTAYGPGDLAVHLILRGGPGRPRTGKMLKRWSRGARRGQPAAPARLGLPQAGYASDHGQSLSFLLRSPDRSALGALLSRIADVAPALSDGELQDLALFLTRAAAAAAPGQADAREVRVALVAGNQDQLAELARSAAELIPRLTTGALNIRPGIFVSDWAGHLSLVLAGRPEHADLPQQELSRILDILTRLEGLGVRAPSAAGYGVGELAGLVWADCISPADARALIALRSAVLAAPRDSAAEQLRDALDLLGSLSFPSPSRRLLSAYTGAELADGDAIAEMLRAELVYAASTSQELANGRLGSAVSSVALGADLLLLTGVDGPLSRALVELDDVPVVLIPGDPSGDTQVDQAAAAMFAIGALTSPQALYADWPGRPIDIWRDPVFITRPAPPPPEPEAEVEAAEPAAPAEPETPVKPEAAAEPATAVGPQAATGAATEPLPADSPPAEGQPCVPESAPAADARPLEEVRQAAAEADALVADEAVAASSTAAQPVPQSSRTDAFPGIAAWARCFTEKTRSPEFPLPARDDRPWRVRTGGCEPLREQLSGLFTHDAKADRTLVVLGSLDDPATPAAAIWAVKDAISTGQLVAICAGDGPSGLFATLRAEHPAIGITVVRTTMTEEGIAAASRLAAATPGDYRELIIGPDGTPLEPVIAPIALPGGNRFPLGHDDVVLISRASGAAGLAFAKVVACSGAAAVIIGRQLADEDGEVIAELERLRSAGARVSYEVVDLADHDALVAAVGRVESRLGRVTALSHATSDGPPLALAELSHVGVHRKVRRYNAALDQLAAAVRTAQRTTAGPSALRLIATFGSVAGRYGLAGEGLLALATGALADHGRRLADATTGCRAVHVDFPDWSGVGLGERADLLEVSERAGYTALPVATGARMLLKVLTTGDLPDRVAVHGRVGLVAPSQIISGAARPAEGTAAADEASGQPGRFLERVLVSYPGIELIAEATISPQTDPYLSDYLMDGSAVMPAAMALEAMAEVASVLAGGPALKAANVSMAAPIVLPAGNSGGKAVLRISGLRQPGSIKVSVSSDLSGFEVEHCRASFSCDNSLALKNEPTAPAGQPDPQSPAGRVPEQRSPKSHKSRAPAMDGSDLYRLTCFQTGRFARLTQLRFLTPRSVTALASGMDEGPWFDPATRSGEGERPATAGLLLGDAGLADAMLQVLQACVPHRRLTMAGCESVTFNGRPATGTVTIRATQVEQPAATPLVPKQPEATDGEEPGTGRPAASASAAQYIWDLKATDEAGRALITWRRVRMRDCGSMPAAGAWPAALLPRYLERTLADLGLGGDLRIDARITSAEGAEPDGQPAALELNAHAPRPVACHWEPVSDPAASRKPGSGSERTSQVMDAIIECVRNCRPPVIGPVGDAGADPAATDDPAGTAGAAAAATAMARAIRRCLPNITAKDLAEAGPQSREFAGVRWLVLRVRQATAAAAVLDIADLGSQVAVAIRTGDPRRAEPSRSRKPRKRSAA